LPGAGFLAKLQVERSFQKRSWSHIRKLLQHNGPKQGTFNVPKTGDSRTGITPLFHADADLPLKLFTLDQFSALAVTYHVC
jgi:hypothetical protein